MPSARTLIAKTTLSASAASVTFSSIPSTYTDLCIRWTAQSDNTPFTTMYINFNNDSTNLYSSTYIQLTGTAAAAGQNVSATALTTTGAMSDSTYTAYSSSELYLPSYTSTNNKPLSVYTAAENNSTTAYFINLYAQLYRNTSAISSITIAPTASISIFRYSSFYLYGISNS